jgi:hypothetical protein
LRIHSTDMIWDVRLCPSRICTAGAKRIRLLGKISSNLRPLTSDRRRARYGRTSDFWNPPVIHTKEIALSCTRSSRHLSSDAKR